MLTQPTDSKTYGACVLIRNRYDTVVYCLGCGSVVKCVMWELMTVSPQQVKVTNAGYSAGRDNHTQPDIKECDGLSVPSECGCAESKYIYDDQQKITLTTLISPTVLYAEVNSDGSVATPSRRMTGTVADDKTADQQEEDDECDCAYLLNDFPCWPCVREGRRELPK